MAKQMPTTAMTTRRTHQAYGKVHRCINNDPKFGSLTYYNRVLVKREDGSFETLLLTDSELVRLVTVCGRTRRISSSPPSWTGFARCEEGLLPGQGSPVYE